ncbi:hypothetical protein FSARC_13386 [Fusarium sarcochroum]|uniref:Uncharacterized protein n=1 Tax=Fusarium sarcochroum TaxID=1208366 RepID=A0A8H4T1V8_9HYPO|nr:hypothetical protein FSARC_13386 [Fusarium sarcochroum]
MISEKPNGWALGLPVSWASVVPNSQVQIWMPSTLPVGPQRSQITNRRRRANRRKWISTVGIDYPATSIVHGGRAELRAHTKYGDDRQASYEPPMGWEEVSRQIRLTASEQQESRLITVVQGTAATIGYYSPRYFPAEIQWPIAMESTVNQETCRQ